MEELSKCGLLVLLLLILNVASQREPKSPCYPRQVRILIGDAYYQQQQQQSPNFGAEVNDNNAPNARIMFQTYQSCLNSQIDITLQGTQPVKKWDSQVEQSKWNTTFCHNGKNCQTVIYDQYVHDVSFYILDEKYFNYTVQGDILDDSTRSDTFVGKMPPMSPKPQKNLEFIYFGDMSLALNGDKTINYLQSLKSNNQSIDSILFLGDYAYEFFNNNGTKGDDFLQAFEPIDTFFPLAISAGNHEDNFNFEFYNQKFHFPLFNLTHNNYYSFNMGPVHFLALNLHFYNNETGVVDEFEREQMLAWVESDLLNADSPSNRQLRPWVIVFGHQPIYCLDYVVCANYYKDYQPFDDFLHKYNIDLFLGAHDHSYQFLGPMYRNLSGNYQTNFTSDLIIDPDATVHLIQGNGGCETMDPSPYYNSVAQSSGQQIIAGGNSTFLPFQNKNFKRKDQQFGNAPSFYNGIGIGKIVVYNDTTLQIESYNASSGQILEKFYLVSNQHQFPQQFSPFIFAETDAKTANIIAFSLVMLISVYMFII